MLDEAHLPRDFHSVVKPAIEDMMGREVTFDILFHNSEHQATLFRYGVKKSLQVSGTRKQRLRCQRWRKCVCLCASDREDLQAHHADLEEADGREAAVKHRCSTTARHRMAVLLLRPFFVFNSWQLILASAFALISL